MNDYRPSSLISMVLLMVPIQACGGTRQELTPVPLAEPNRAQHANPAHAAPDTAPGAPDAARPEPESAVATEFSLSGDRVTFRAVTPNEMPAPAEARFSLGPPGDVSVHWSDGSDTRLGAFVVLVEFDRAGSVNLEHTGAMLHDDTRVPVKAVLQGPARKLDPASLLVSNSGDVTTDIVQLTAGSEENSATFVAARMPGTPASVFVLRKERGPTPIVLLFDVGADHVRALEVGGTTLSVPRKTPVDRYSGTTTCGGMYVDVSFVREGSGPVREFKAEHGCRGQQRAVTWEPGEAIEVDIKAVFHYEDAHGNSVEGRVDEKSARGKFKGGVSVACKPNEFRQMCMTWTAKRESSSEVTTP